MHTIKSCTLRLAIVLSAVLVFGVHDVRAQSCPIPCPKFSTIGPDGKPFASFPNGSKVTVSIADLATSLGLSVADAIQVTKDAIAAVNLAQVQLGKVCKTSGQYDWRRT